MGEYKYISENTTTLLSFHDCCASRVHYSGGSFVLEMEWLEVLAAHPLNPYPQAHRTGSAKVIFEDAVIVDGTASMINTEGKICEQSLSEWGGAIELGFSEIMEYREEPTDGGFAARFYIMEDSASARAISLKLRFAKSRVMWNELTRISWFESDT